MFETIYGEQPMFCLRCLHGIKDCCKMLKDKLCSGQQPCSIMEQGQCERGTGSCYDHDQMVEMITEKGGILVSVATPSSLRIIRQCNDHLRISYEQGLIKGLWRPRLTRSMLPLPTALSTSLNKNFLCFQF
jgi:hypothetical protein